MTESLIERFFWEEGDLKISPPEPTPPPPPLPVEELKKFDPHQLRDPHTGEWTDEPGGSGETIDAPPIKILTCAGEPAPEMVAQFDPTLHGAARAQLDNNAPSEVLDLIKGTHKWPKGATSIPMRPTDAMSEGARGEFVQHGTRPKEIRIDQLLDKENATQAFTHEMGHYLDMSMAEEGVGFLSEGYPSPAMERFLEIARASEAMDTVRRQGKPADIDYLDRPRELWARAYAQWLLGHAASASEEGAWNGPDFRPIGQAVHAVLVEQGLI